ncbi:hypothetical protein YASMINEVIRUS_26 [Yasminevirus sp. GU-2018]|uniref:Uncharacterized protein n=1 Tax=Yasminevirus sp. GU-2018 TaxID=2420051 RepID=A0A5K0U7V3_9VIRU|nr:hypothetical protein YASMINEVIRUS_26 [Yasminevirus sp. GU-2018]
MGGKYSLFKSYECYEIDITLSKTLIDPSRKARYGYFIAAHNQREAVQFYNSVNEYVKLLTPYYLDPFDKNIRCTVQPNVSSIDFYQEHSGFKPTPVNRSIIDRSHICRVLDGTKQISMIRVPWHITDFKPKLFMFNDKNLKIFFICAKNIPINE